MIPVLNYLLCKSIPLSKTESPFRIKEENRPSDDEHSMPLCVPSWQLLPRIPCGCQTEELFLSWILKECVHPSLPHFLASSGTLEPRGLKSSSRPTSAILFWWEKSHPGRCTGSAWKALRKRVFPLSVDWHLGTDHGTCPAMAGFLW